MCNKRPKFNIPFFVAVYPVLFHYCIVLNYIQGKGCGNSDVYNRMSEPAEATHLVLLGFDEAMYIINMEKKHIFFGSKLS